MYSEPRCREEVFGQRLLVFFTKALLSRVFSAYDVTVPATWTNNVFLHADFCVAQDFHCAVHSRKPDELLAQGVVLLGIGGGGGALQWSADGLIK